MYLRDNGTKIEKNPLRGSRNGNNLNTEMNFLTKRRVPFFLRACEQKEWATPRPTFQILPSSA